MFLRERDNSQIYGEYNNTAAKFLAESAALMTRKLGLGLDASGSLLAYPAIYAPMASILHALSERELRNDQRQVAERGIVRWFIASILTGRYQASTHDKQQRDRADILRWVENGDEFIPQWLKEHRLTSLRAIDPNGAIGRLIRAVLNSNGLKDPVTQEDVGVGSGKKTSAVHHIFPSRFVRHLEKWSEEIDSADIALNVMFTEERTNSSWLNNDPRLQVEESIKVCGRIKTEEIYKKHGISETALAVLLKPNKTRDDFWEFISLREEAVARELESWGIIRSTGPSASEAMLDEFVEEMA